MTRNRISLNAAFLLLGAVSASATAPRVAQLKTVEGTVSITRSEGGATETAEQKGGRVRNGSVFGGDEVMTDGASTATLVFTDGSAIDLKAATRLTIEEVDRASMVAAGGTEKPIGRRIKVLAGDVLANVIPNPKVATEFETPSGVAAVKGTTLSISVK